MEKNPLAYFMNGIDWFWTPSDEEPCHSDSDVDHGSHGRPEVVDPVELGSGGNHGRLEIVDPVELGSGRSHGRLEVVDPVGHVGSGEIQEATPCLRRMNAVIFNDFVVQDSMNDELDVSEKSSEFQVEGCIQEEFDMSAKFVGYQVQDSENSDFTNEEEHLAEQSQVHECMNDKPEQHYLEVDPAKSESGTREANPGLRRMNAFVDEAVQTEVSFGIDIQDCRTPPIKRSSQIMNPATFANGASVHPSSECDFQTPPVKRKCSASPPPINRKAKRSLSDSLRNFPPIPRSLQGELDAADVVV